MKTNRCPQKLGEICAHLLYLLNLGPLGKEGFSETTPFLLDKSRALMIYSLANQGDRTIELELVMERVGKLEGRMDEHHELFEALNGRMGSLEKRMESIEQRINSLDAKIDNLGARLDGKMTRFFTWVIGLLMTSWLSIVLLILAKF